MNSNKEEEKKEPQDDKRLVYDDINHLNELMKEIVSYYKDNGYDNFEEISMYIKKKNSKLTLSINLFHMNINQLLFLLQLKKK